ncbi:HORMA domain-containing protein 1-like isoform X5 [Oncorhynchus keta]|uniref:HORMA domain-containing protein 1-like isoform X5 n=1 Tax=Oncorhynchus keta TaxID=8018 RepID=UPI00227CBBD8|nr:HORMA domain-containing protein 1-like isoform X5 [Oncorhynchus keta]
MFTSPRTVCCGGKKIFVNLLSTSFTTMACEQRLRAAQGTQLLPNVVSTEQQSLIVVKKLLAIAVSSITYLRGLFPEKAYGRKFVEEQKVMILREERTCPGASQIVQWMQGCFDALQRKYLRTVVMSIYTDPDNPKKVTECYQFKVQYTEKGPKIDFESKNSKNLGKMACSNTKKSSLLLVRKLYTLMQNLGPLPDNVCLNMKLSYYDDELHTCLIATTPVRSRERRRLKVMRPPIPNQAALLLNTAPSNLEASHTNVSEETPCTWQPWLARTAPGPPQGSLVRNETRISIPAKPSLTRTTLGQLCVAPRTYDRAWAVQVLL